ncbi:hypothetical protein FRB95_008745 [Tulasnella sp. JGI-2019a]|nr:hypothetical protein FRB95_008745 [Tulasnella sp. JGI-2019a]
MSEETPDSRIRILIMGTAGVGKTTILQKICSETDTPIVRNPEGEVISSPDSLVPTTARGLHDINLEITYPSRPGFVFHDSRGIECGSANELNEMREFLIQRAKNATNAIHVIWYCISANSDRPLVPAERQFFERDMGKVPVVVIFTKLDGLETRAYNHLKAEGLTRKAAFQGRKARANEMLQEHFVKRIMELAHPPMGFVSFKGLHKPGQHCAELTRKTVEALKHNQDLQARFVLASRYDLKARLMALGGWIRKQEMSMTDEALTRGVLLYFPHVWRRVSCLYVTWHHHRS